MCGQAHSTPKEPQMTSRKLLSRLSVLGFTADESQALIEISAALSKWGEAMCNGTIRRDGDEGTGNPRIWRENGRGEWNRGPLTEDREASTKARLVAIVARRNADSSDIVHAYCQTDPRGCALYLVTAEQLRGRDIDCCYPDGLAVCV